MATQINQFQATKSPLDALSSALNVVNQYYGIKANSAALEKAKKDQEELESAKQRAKDGVLTKAEFLKEGNNYDFSDTQKSGSVEYKIQEGDQQRSVFLRPKASPLMNPQKNAFDLLPVPNQEVIKDLSKSNATKIDIKNEIDTALEVLKSPQVSEEQKIAAGENLFKTLNSTQGKDAVGAEEAKRLGSFLQYKMANLTAPGSFWGRDLDEFTDQVAIQSARLGQAVVKNESKIQNLYGRNTPQVGPITIPELQGGSKKRGQSPLIPDAVAGEGQKFTDEDLAMLKTAKERLAKNPDDATAKQALSILNTKGLK